MKPLLVIASHHRYYSLYVNRNRLDPKECRFISRPFDLDGRDRTLPVVHVLPSSLESARTMALARDRGHPITLAEV